MLALAAAAGVGLAAGVALADDAPQPVRIDDPRPGKARIVFYRRWEYAGGAISYIVREGKAEIGQLNNGGYFIADVDPGLHTYTVHAERHKDMQIIAEEGEIYYVRYELDIGVILYQPDLTPAEQWQFEQISAKLKLAPPLASADPSKAAATPPAAPAPPAVADAPATPRP